MADSPSVIGLIAGNGKFPLLFAKAARDKGLRVVAVAVKGDTSCLIHFFAPDVRWFPPVKIKDIFAHFRSRGVKKVLMAGQLAPEHLFDRALMADPDLAPFFKALTDRRCDTIFGAFSDLLEREGLEVLDSTFLLNDHLAPKGTLTRKAPTKEQLVDIEFGLNIAKEIGGLDIGQTVVVHEKAILAIEALEGTDRCIERGGRIARVGAVIVKTSKPKQDSRFDVPVIGEKTIKTMARVKASCLAIEAGKTLIIDRDATVKLANKYGITIVSA